MKSLKPALILVSVCAVIFTSCGGKEDSTPTPVPTPTAKPEVKFQKYGWSVLVPDDVKVVETGLIQKEADQTSGKVEWGDAFKDGLVAVFWIKGATRENYDIATGTASLASSYEAPSVAVVSNFSELRQETIANLAVDMRTYDFNFFGSEVKGTIAVYQCTNPDTLIFINSLYKEPMSVVENVLSRFSCS